MERYDLAVIGGGTAGLVAAAGGALLGAKVILFEGVALGGDCLWTGCVPTKALIRSARVRHAQRTGDSYGVGSCAPEYDYGDVAARMRAIRAAIEPHDSPARFRALGVDVVLERARLAGPKAVASESRRIEARRVLIATGGRSVAPPIDGLETLGYLTHVTAIELDALPASVLVLGGGPIGLEFAQLFRRLGVDVTVLEQADRILPAEDADASAAVREVLRAEGVRIETGVSITRAERADGRKRLRGQDRQWEAEEVLVATGRRANLDGLGLEATGVEAAPQGITVDDRMRTSVPGVFAAGDVTGRYLFTHVADYEARAVVANALVPGVRRRVDYDAVPWVIFTDPELARVGLTEAEARDRHGDAIRVYRYPLEDLDRAIIDGQAAGFVKLVADRRGRLLGAHLVAPDAGGLVGVLALAVTRRLRLGDLAATVFPYPTFGEAVKRAAELSLREKLDTRGGRLLRRWVRWRGA